MNKEVLVIVAQFFGILTFLLSFMSTKSDTRKKILFYNTIANFVCALQYFCLVPTKESAITGAICSVLAGCRNFVFCRYEKVPLPIVIGYIVILSSINIPFVHNFLGIVPIINVAVTAYALSQDNVITIKIMGLYTGFSSLAYDLLSYAFAGALTDMISIFTTSAVLYNLYKKYLLEKNIELNTKEELVTS